MDMQEILCVNVPRSDGVFLGACWMLQDGAWWMIHCHVQSAQLCGQE
jgi:hypothetical protein